MGLRLKTFILIFSLALALPLAAGVTAAAQTGTVSAGSATIGVGETAEIPIVYDIAPAGLAGYNITVSLSNGAVADITDVTFVAFAAATSVSIAPDGNSVTFSAADFVGGVEPGDTNKTLATVTFVGVAGGTSAIQVQLNTFDGDGGAQLLPIPDQSACFPNCAGTADGTLTVQGPVDEIPPSFSNRQPAPGTTVTDTRQPTVSVDIIDDGGASPSGVDPASITMTVTGCAGTFTTASSGADWSPPTFSVDLAAAGCSLANGSVTVTVNASDNAGNPSSTSWSFTVDVPEADTTPPSFSNPQPASGATVEDQQPTLSVGITDTQSGVDAATIQMRVTDDSGAVHTFTTASLGADWSPPTFSVDLSAAGIVLAEGPVTVTVDASDNAGNPSSTSWSFTVTLPPPPTAPTVSAGSASVNRGETVQISITYNSAPQGLAGYLMTVSLANPAVADIEGVDFVVFDNLAKQATISSDKKSVTFRATDFAGEVNPGDTDITLARITLRGLAEGTSAVQVVLNRFDADGGADLVPTTDTRDGSLTVNPGAPLPAVRAGSASVGAGETVSIAITYDRAPQGLAGYIITVSLASPVIADIEGVEFVVFDNLAKRVTLASDRKSVTFSGTDFAGEVRPGDTGITLARITLRGLASGTSALQVRLDRFDADDGSDLIPLTETGEGSLTVTGGPTPPQVSAGSAGCNVGETVEIPVTYDRAPQGLSGYIMTASLANPAVAQIEAVDFVVFDNLAKRVTLASDRKSVTFSGADFAGEVNPDDTGITLARITFRCLQNGTSAISLQLERFDSDTGSDLIPSTATGEGSLTVGGPGVDVTAPSFSNEQPPSGGSASLQPTISVTIIDDGGETVSGVDPASITMTITGCGTFTTASTGADWSDPTFSVDLAVAGCELAAGSVDVSVSASDNAGNSASTSWSFTASPTIVDDVPPSFSNWQPTPDSTVGTAQPTVSVDITDDSSPDPSGVDPNTIAMTVTGCARDFTIAGPGVTWDGTTFSVDLAAAGCTLADGSVTVTVNASDNAGNPNSTSWSFTVSVPAIRPGDVNGDGRIDRTDANLVTRFIFTGTGLNEAQRQAANVALPCGPPDDRSTINFADVTAITQVAIGIRREFVCFPGVPVSITGASTTSPAIPLQVAGITAHSNSNSNSGPLAVHFRVEGQGVAEMRVEVFSLQGMKVWDSGYLAGQELAWQLRNDQGEVLANGVYLYVVTVRGFNGELIRSGLRKLAVLR